MNYLTRNLIALDQMVNTLVGGWPDETISARAYRAEMDQRLVGRVLRPLIDLLFFFDRDHCASSYLSEITDRHLPHRYREVGKKI